MAVGEKVVAKESTPSNFTHLPKVSKEALRALVHELTTDPTYSQRVFKDHNNRDHELMSGVLAEANKQADGDMDRQLSFIRGAEYVLAALQRQVDTDYLETLWEKEQTAGLFLAEEPPSVA